MDKHCVICTKIFSTTQSAITCSKECSKKRRRERETSPVYRQMQKKYRDNPINKLKVKQFNMEYRKIPKNRQKEKERAYLPKYKQKQKEWREKNKLKLIEYAKRPERKIYLKNYRLKPEVRQKEKERASQPRARQLKIMYSRRPDIVQRRKEYNQSLLRKQQRIVWSKKPRCKKLHCIRSIRRRSIKKLAKGDHTLEEWESLRLLLGNHCLGCWRTDLKLTQDHIIPLVKSGSNWIDNIQPLCLPCNASKGASYDVPNLVEILCHR